MSAASIIDYSRLRDTLNTAIELHDSTVAEITRRNDTVVVLFVPAYLHKSEGRPGVDPGTGWVQDARLLFAAGVISGDVPNLPCDVMDGELVLKGESLDNGFPMPFESMRPTTLRLVFDAVHTVTVTGLQFRAELLGEPRYVEDFRP